MSTLESRNLRFSVKDLVWLLTVVVGIASNYYAVKTVIITNKLEQDKQNAIFQLQIQNLDNSIDKNTMDIKDLQYRIQSGQKYVPNTEKPL